ncbi:MAG: anti-sigma factor antagonist [Chloroflexi bacterium]|nr:anti-sigma factor antagonist [Chloroflexota bacterium]
MAQMTATMDVRPVNNKVNIIDIHGQVTAAAENALMDAYTKACDNNARAIILNFGGLEYMNSTGIGLLVTLLIRVNRQKQKLLTYGLSEHYRQIFELTRLDDAIAIYNSEAEAVASA